MTPPANVYAFPPCIDCQRRKKKCYHEKISASGSAHAEKRTPGSSPSPVRVGDYHPESILTDLSSALDGNKAAQPSDPEPGSSFQRSRFRLSQIAADSSTEQRQTEWWNYHRRRPIPKPLSEHLRNHLEDVGAFLVLPRSTTDALIPTYISVIDGLVPVVDGAKVLHDYSNGQVSNFLIRAICLVTCKTEQAAPFLQLNDGDPVLEPLVFAQKLYEGLDAALGAELERDRITKIQILALMHLCNDGLAGVERASARLSQAIHESWAISLHFNVPGNPIQPQCDMLWWSLRCFDRLNKFIQGAPFMISDNDIQIARPEAGASYQSQILAISLDLGDLLIKLGTVYNPNSPQHVDGVESFPAFSEFTKRVRFHEFQSAHRNYLEIWYHVAAMLSCRSSSPDSGPYERRLKSAERIQEIMSYGRHVYLPPLPLIPYAIAMSLTVVYRALRENKKNFNEGYNDLTTRFEILESLGQRWTTARDMTKLAKKALKFLKKRKSRAVVQNDGARQASSRSEVDIVQSNANMDQQPPRNTASQHANVETMRKDVDCYWPLEQDESVAVPFSNEAENPNNEIYGAGNLDSVELIDEWSTNNMYFNYGANISYDLSNIGIVNMFRDPTIWGMSPNLTDDASSVSSHPTAYFGDHGQSYS